jgi:hypothetical protein
MVGKRILGDEHSKDHPKARRRHSNDAAGYRPRPKALRFADVAQAEQDEQSREMLKNRLLKSIDDNIERFRKDPEEVRCPVPELKRDLLTSSS